MKHLGFAVMLAVALAFQTRTDETIVWKSIEKSLQTQLITVADGDTIRLPEGHFMFSKSLTMDGKKGW
ncbi:MAG: hypothetical protein ACKOEV_15720 [Cytophagales bacterium]